MTVKPNSVVSAADRKVIKLGCTCTCLMTVFLPSIVTLLTP